jgi:hypothetical protein
MTDIHVRIGIIEPTIELILSGTNDDDVASRVQQKFGQQIDASKR